MRWEAVAVFGVWGCCGLWLRKDTSAFFFFVGVGVIGIRCIIDILGAARLKGL